MTLDTGVPEPRRDGPAAGEPGNGSGPSRGETGRPIGVLIVDDDPLVRTLLAEMVRRESDIAILGCATDGLDAVAKAAELRPNVILMDLAMPRLDGLAALARLAELNLAANVLIFTHGSPAVSSRSWPGWPGSSPVTAVRRRSFRSGRKKSFG